MSAEESVDPASLVLGGRSMGGRVCSLAVADGLPAAGLALLSLPAAPTPPAREPAGGPFRPTHGAVLFVSGDRDPFGTPGEFAEHTSAIPGAVTHVWLPGRGHDTRPADDEAVAAAVRRWLVRSAG